MTFNTHRRTSFVFAIILSWFIFPSFVLANLTPSVDAGLDQKITLVDCAFLKGAITGDSLPDPPGTVSYTWSQLSGPGTITFDRREEVLATATFPARGIYALRLTVDDGNFTDSDDLTVTVTATAPNTIRVPQDYPSIQAGIDAAQPRDLVLVSPGSYVENLYVSKTITLASTFYTTGDGSLIDKTVINSPDSSTNTIVVSSDTGSETKIVGFKIRGGKNGIKIRGKAKILSNHLVESTRDAVDFSPDAAGLVQKNVMENNGDDGIDINHAAVLIRQNLVQENEGDGIEIRTKNNDGPTLAIIIRGNVLVANTEDGIQLIDNDTIVDTATLLVIDRNLIANNAQAGLGLMDNATSTEDFRAANLLERIHLLNNTFGGNLYGVTGGDNLIAINNIFVDHNNIAIKQVGANSVVSYSLFWNNGTNEQESTVDIKTTLFANPGLDTEYKLGPNSPAIDAGTDLFMMPSGETVLNLSNDTYFGKAPDLGWYEYWGNFPPIIEAGTHQSITLPVLKKNLIGSITDDRHHDPSETSTSIWAQVSGPPGVVFRNPNDLETTATFPGVGVYAQRLTASDSELTSTDGMLGKVIDPSVGSSDVRVAASSDDAEERSSGSINLTSSDLELIAAGSEQTVGMRFNGVTVPQGALITNAYVQFQADEVDTGATNLYIEGQADDHPSTFTDSKGNVSGRSRTAAGVWWTPEPWTTKGEAGPDQQTPDISSIIQEIVEQPAWASGNSLVIIITGNGKRTAESYDGDSAGAPLLHVEYSAWPYNGPLANDDSAETPEDVPVTIDVLTNDALVDHAAISAFDTISTNGGTLVSNGDGTFDYSPAPNFNGTDTFTYTICDDGPQASTATVTVTVTPVSDGSPQAVGDAFNIEEGGVLNGNVFDDNGSGGDILGDPPNSVDLVTDVSNGTLNLNMDGSFDYTPNSDFTGSDSFSYTITDDDMEISNAAMVAITVNAVGDGSPQADNEAVRWRLIGPGTRGTLHGPAFHPTNPEIFSIGVDMGLHFITNDGGKTWDVLGKNVSSKYTYGGYPGLGSANETVFDPKNPRVIWAGSSHGLYKSTDGGENWAFLLGGGTSYFIGNIELDPMDPDIVYAGSGEPGAGFFQNWVNGSVIYKTADGGTSWETINPLGEDQTRGNVWARILIDPNSTFIAGKGHQRIFALRHPKSTTPGLIISEDYGATWKKEDPKLIGDNDSLEFNYITLVSDHEKTILFASMFPGQNGDKTYGGIYRSDDLGKTWLEKNKGLEKAINKNWTNPLIKIASTPADSNILFCVVKNEVFKSTDQGESWQKVLYPSGQWYDDIPDFDGKYAEYLLQTKEGNWEWSVRGIIGGFHSIAIAPSSADHVIITGMFGGVMTTNGGKTWFDIGFEYGEKSSVYDLAMKKFGPMTRPSTFTHKRLARKNFQVIVPNDVALDPFNNSNLAIAYGDEGMQISRDGGSSWEWAYWGILFREAVDARAVVYDPDVKNRLFIGTMGKVDLQTLGEKEIWKLYQSDDGGITFKSVGPDFMPSHNFIKDNFDKYNSTRGKMITLGVKDILIDPISSPNKRTMYIAYSTGAFKTIDGGESWKEIIKFNSENISDVSNDKYYLKLEMNPENNLEIYLATYEGLYKTADGGELWGKVFPEEFGTIKSLALAKNDPTVIYVVATKGEGKLSATSDSHLWKSVNAGKTWKKIDEQQTQFVTVHPKDENIVYRALYARDIRYEDTGLFRSKNGGMTWEKVNPNLPMSFKGGFKRKCQIVFDPNNTQHFYVVTWCGVYEGWDTEVPR